MATTIVWDSTLPTQFQQDSYTEDNINNLIESEMNLGPYKSRPKSTEAYQTLKGALLLSTNQRATFYNFYKSTIAWGSLSFLFLVPGSEYDYMETKIKSFSCVPVNGNTWKLTLSLIVLVTV